MGLKRTSLSERESPVAFSSSVAAHRRHGSSILVLAFVLLIGVAEIGVVSCGTWASPRAGEPVVIFSADDPSGDDRGPGTYVYPKDKTFSQHPGLFDLTHFEVSYDAEYVYFDLTFKEVTNPWNAPEGFSHQLIDIYIVTGSKGGRTEPLGRGPRVSFSRRFPWQFEVKGIPWGGSRVFTSNDSPDSSGIADGVRATLLADGKTIRLAVSRAILGEPLAKWRYYVLIGSQDAFGIDDWRPVMRDAGDWVFGGGTDLEVHPNVIDLLVPPGSSISQERMLGSYKAGRGSLAVLTPVGPRSRENILPAFMPISIAILLLAAALLLWVRRHAGRDMQPR